jgi:hypothetical protein
MAVQTTDPKAVLEGQGWIASPEIARACEAGFGERAVRREGPSHIVATTAHGHSVADVSHHADPELVAAMCNAAHADTVDWLANAFGGSKVIAAANYNERARVYRYAATRRDQHDDDVDEAPETLW